MTNIEIEILEASMEKKSMTELGSKSHRELKNKMTEALSDRMKGLSLGMQDILLDDLATAFENRIKILNRAQGSVDYQVQVAVEVTQ